MHAFPPTHSLLQEGRDQAVDEVSQVDIVYNKIYMTVFLGV